MQTRDQDHGRVALQPDVCGRAAHQFGQLGNVAVGKDDHHLAPQLPMESLAHRVHRRAADHPGEKTGNACAFDMGNLRYREADEFAPDFGDRGPGLSHADVGDFLQRIALVDAQFAVRRAHTITP